jgi:hypothetical protein
MNVVVVEHWWNGSWGRLARYDLRLLQCGDRWRVTAQRGGAKSPRVWESRVFDREWAARALLDRLKKSKATPGDPKFKWTNLTRLRPASK